VDTTKLFETGCYVDELISSFWR